MSESLANKATALLRQHGMMRSAELRAAGVTPATIQRLAASGEILRLSRGLYQLADAPVDSQHDLAEAAKRVPKGVVCLTSALAYHGLTDQHPRRVWMAIGLSDWTPAVERPALHIVRMSRNLLSEDVERHAIEGVEVKIFGIARSIVDAFRLERSVGRNLAIEALREALRGRRATPGEIAVMAERRGAWLKMRPYLEAMTADA
jgi:predicted transcriptional regulator of viral defense system